MVSARETADVLGIGLPVEAFKSVMWMSRQVSAGLPLSSLERVADKLAPDDKGFVYGIVPKATWARRRKALDAEQRERPVADRQTARAALSPEESAKVARLAEVWSMARQVWGSDSKARAFLFRPHPMLEGQRPVDVVISNEFGRPLVENILGGLLYGSAP